MSLDHEATLMPTWADTVVDLDALDDDPSFVQCTDRVPLNTKPRHLRHPYISGKLFGGRRAVINT